MAGAATGEVPGGGIEGWFFSMVQRHEGVLRRSRPRDRLGPARVRFGFAQVSGGERRSRAVLRIVAFVVFRSRMLVRLER